MALGRVGIGAYPDVARRRLPLAKIEKDYRVDGPGGQVRLPDMFEGRHTLYIYSAFARGLDYSAVGYPFLDLTPTDVKSHGKTHLPGGHRAEPSSACRAFKPPPEAGAGVLAHFFGLSAADSVDSAATKASCGTSTRPMVFMRFLPSFCFSSSLRLRVMSPP